MKTFNSQRLVVTGCDSVDSLVVRAGGTEKATAIVHSMIINFLHFQDMRVERAQRMLQAAREELSTCRQEVATSAKNGAPSAILWSLVGRFESLEAEVIARAKELKAEQLAEKTDKIL